jgi:hypothetical protein
MPCVSRFFGIAIYLYFDDHFPAHFHAFYGGEEAIYEIQTLDIYSGRLPRRAHNMVLEWAFEHRNELMENWEIAKKGETPGQIEPLR